MTKEEFIKKAKELGLSIEEIDRFIKNQEIAEQYGFSDKYNTVNVEIDPSLAEEEEKNSTNKDTQEKCDCECHCEHDCDCECHCEHDCKCHHHNN